MADQLLVMISSTAADLPEHRKQVVEACLRQGMFPLRMEDLPATSDDAAAASVKLVDDADIFIGVIAHRYGYIPKANNAEQISVTEMEYNRAVERKIPRLIFIIDKNHPLADFTIDDIDTGESAKKLAQFKSRAETENIGNFFKSPDDLRAHAIDSLSRLRQPDLTTFHYVSDIPQPPEVYIAHPYTLLQTHTLIGRQRELKLLTDWITGKELDFDGHQASTDSVRIMSLIAIGGMGKSALTWKWFNDVAPQEMKSLAGRMWWSFYESDATFGNFVIRALAYVSKRSIDEVVQIPAPERETQLLAGLDREPFLLVLDGLERILIAYARMDASRLDDSEVGKEKNLRKTADPRVGRFLQKLVQVKQSRILVSSRLYPAELETVGGDPIPDSFRIGIEGLTDEDAVELWRAFKVSGSRDEVLPVFNTFAKHPLLIQALAGEVKRYRKAPGDFAAWRKANSKFDPSKFQNLHAATRHVFDFALIRLTENARWALQVIAAARMPTRYDTLAALMITKKGRSRRKPLTNERELDQILTELEDRGLVGWDKRANRYDLHPVVRNLVWSDTSEPTRRVIYKQLRGHFGSLPKATHYDALRLDDLTPTIEFYYSLIGLERFDEAIRLFQTRLAFPLSWRLDISRLPIELLESLFPDGLSELPRLSNTGWQRFALASLSYAYHYRQPGRSAKFCRWANTICAELSDKPNLSIGLGNLSDTLRITGALYESEHAARMAWITIRGQHEDFLQAVNLGWLGLVFAVRGNPKKAQVVLRRVQKVFTEKGNKQAVTYLHCCLAENSLRLGNIELALSSAEQAWKLVETDTRERDLIEAARLQGEVALAMSDFKRADERLHLALARARKMNIVQDELSALVDLADLRRRQEEMTAARDLLEDVWEFAERGPYTLIHADALNVLTQIERDEGNTSAAIEAATKAYQLAWCDGPPFAYHWGLEKAKQHLKELGALEPEMPAFDESKFEPMPEVEIDPHDEFHVDESAESE